MFFIDINIKIPILHLQINGSSEEILSPAEQMWDANENDTLADSSTSREPNYVKLPETKMDLRRLTLEDLAQWIYSHNVCYTKLRNKKAALRAEQTWHGT